MAEAAEAIEFNGETLEDLEQEWSQEQAEVEAKENEPTKAEKEKAEKLARKLNSGFLYVVNRTACPHVKVDQVIDREEGDQAFQDLAERWGGEVPEWLARWEPYIAAGVYMGTTIATARQAERQAIEILKAQHQQQQEGGQNGAEPGHATTE